MVAGGQGWRLGFGWFALMFDVLCICVLLPLLWRRRHWQPIKAYSPAMLMVLVLCKLPLIVMYDLREAALIKLNCGSTRTEHSTAQHRRTMPS
jgi:hypothetical protein